MPAPRIVPAVVREHAELAAFQWAQRDTLSQEDPPDAAVIAGIDKRLEANLDGLRIAGAAAWPFVIDQYEEYPEKGELFVVAVMALEQGDARRIDQAVGFARSAARGPRGLCGAFEWLSPAVTRAQVREWVGSRDPVECEAAVAALIAHRAAPVRVIERLLLHQGPGVRAAACRLAAVLVRHEAVPDLRRALRDPEATVRDGAASALARLGHRDGEELLKARVVALGLDWKDALRTLVGTVPEAELKPWLAALAPVPETRIITVRAAGMLGDKKLASWLIEEMREPALAATAGEAFCELFPATLTNDDLWSVDPEVLGAAFADHFGEEMPRLPVAAKVRVAGFT